MLSQASEVLDDGCQQELVVGTCHATQPETGERKIALHISEQNLDFLPLAA